MAKTSLRTRLRSVRRRLLWIASAAAVTWALALAVVLLLVAAWLDLLWELSPHWRIGMLCVSGAGALGLAGVLVRTAGQAGRFAPVARRVDRAAGTGGDVLSGLELDGGPRGQPATELTVGLARMAVDHAAAVAGRVPVAKAAPARPLGRSLAAFGLMLCAVGLLVVCLPGLARTEFSRFTNPFGDEPPFSRTQFDVSPGDTDVLYGSGVDIRAAVRGAPVEQVELVLEGEAGRHEVLPMFPEPDGRWRAAVAKVAEPAVYHVRSYRARSKRYRIGVITVPRMENVRMRITPPAYTNQAPYEGPMPKHGVAGLRGTKVRIWATSNRPLSGGTLTVAAASKATEHKMKPTAGDGREVVGEFEITGDGKFELRVIDVARQPSQQSFAGTITLLADQRPFVRLMQPNKTSLATPTAALPVAVSAEDDYGISRVQLYRSLNDSRPLPLDLPVAERAPRRLYDQVYLPLSEYGLEPGDVIKLFGRVEDNDPAGGKGSESSVATVRIISQEEFERMLRVRKGIEVLMSKYGEARRRLEGLAKETEGLRKKVKDQPPQSPVGQETGRELKRLLRRLQTDSEALRKLLTNKLPYDIDENLTPQIEQVATMTEQMLAELEKLAEQMDLSNAELAEKLKDLIEQLTGGRQQFQQQAIMPLEHLEAVFPLLVDQSRFVVLALHQRDLAERLAALKGRDGEDNPALKTRMRDLQQEQGQLREALGTLLDDIEDHVERLPDKPEFDNLRQTAAKFAKEVRASGAAEAMAEAEAGLAEFSGTRGHQNAKQAADILEKFLKKCEGMGGCAGNCLAFQPTLSNCLGNSVAQILADIGLGMGTGSGTGMGTGIGGSSARGGNFGLYGGLPGMGEAFGSGPTGQGPSHETPGQFARGGPNPDESPLIDLPAEAGAAGVSDAVVPLPYRRRVGQYFQRIAEEVGER